MIPDGDGWRRLTGNQIGILLGDYALRMTEVAEPLILNSIVSTPMLGAIAASYGAFHAETLTGFKWIWNAALDLEAEHKGTFVFGFEEALGYSVSPAVRDKDGISAAVFFADLASEDSVSIVDALQDLYVRHGLWVSHQHSIVRPGTEGAAEIAGAVDRVAADPPDSLGGDAVEAVTDFRLGADERPRYLGAAALVRFDLASGGRVLVRPSGTEPKLKIYVDLRSELAADSDWRESEPALLEAAGHAAAELTVAIGLS